MKIIVLLILGAILYRLVFPPPKIETKAKKENSSDFVEYEELD